MSTYIPKEADKVPEPTLRRLPWYLSNIKLMKEKGGAFRFFYSNFQRNQY